MKGKWWILAVPALLLPVVIVNTVMLFKTMGEYSVSIEPDYYQKAVDWDQHMAQQADNDRLGWNLMVDLKHAQQGVVELGVNLYNARGDVIPDAQLHVEAFHNALSNQRIQLDLLSRNDAYFSLLPVTRAGLWELRFRVQRAETLFTALKRIEIDSALLQ